jgi:hypothetical protein
MTDNERQDDEMNAGLSAAEHEILRKELRALPDTMPPRAVWQRIEEQARAEGLFTARHQFERYKWVAGAAIAATVAMIALNMPMGNIPVVGPNDGATTVPTEVADGSEQELNALKVESQILERNLRLLPEQPTVMKVSTASTIQELQNRIAAIDYRLNDRTIKLEPEQEEVYWRERVRLMKSLVRLRYAQSQRVVF